MEPERRESGAGAGVGRREEECSTGEGSLILAGMTNPDPRWCALMRAAAPPRPRAPAVVDRADFDPAYDPARPIECEVCGMEMRYTGACKILCSNCGYKRDCSDP